MSVSTGSAEWNGGKKGAGTMTPEHGASAPFSLVSRFEGKPGSNPEELIGAALSGCFSMALTIALEKAGRAPQSVRTTAEVHLDEQTGGFVIRRITLTTVASVAPGTDPVRFLAIAEETSRTCPVAKLLSAATITLKASMS